MGLVFAACPLPPGVAHMFPGRACPSPHLCSVPTWLRLTSDDEKEQVYKVAEKGLTPSQMGAIPRDSHGVEQAPCGSR